MFKEGSRNAEMHEVWHTELLKETTTRFFDRIHNKGGSLYVYMTFSSGEIYTVSYLTSGDYCNIHVLQNLLFLLGAAENINK